MATLCSFCFTNVGEEEHAPNCPLWAPMYDDEDKEEEDSANQCPECLQIVDQAELNMFGGIC